MGRAVGVAMVSDFFYPSKGGVEMHVYQLSQCLMKRGFRVIVITHARGPYRGVQWMPNGLKVYYLHYRDVVDNVILPTVFMTLPAVRHILLREHIDIVHSHQATSPLGHECLIHARTLSMYNRYSHDTLGDGGSEPHEYRIVYTDHSLFGFADVAGIHINKVRGRVRVRVISLLLSDVDHAICVSHTNRENLTLRSGIPPRRIAVIPNAVDAHRFSPDPSMRPPPPRVNIVVISRLTYRKGIDLLVDVIPAICEQFPNVHFIIGGDGGKRTILEEMREEHRLIDRVEMLGAVPHSQVRDILRRGHIFLNSSLTEAFCIAIIEAAACGLLVVSTRVGGVPEVLPEDMMRLAEPNAASIVGVLGEAIHRAPNIDAFEHNRQILGMYCWHDIAERTEAVYRRVLGRRPRSFASRVRLYKSLGAYSGTLVVFLLLVNYLLLNVLEWCRPRRK
ncbi:unnamed protein product [Vitrella brassicaformis CCMP3155]|uniref:Phosphatidylinositol N-acetylglucosaminyltransferase n=1 Tax=Vitrella brassicaformis (strain CCMP3155) TaxID=1169540 RepID=A0A0G4EIK2_VITBC|nr:unnamed protein product [Vitrella brassicaformis CCMP3155]|eukprot:CEL95811.1 unnamed protein product [Vitrella brassicaformis CCMP3155]